MGTISEIPSINPTCAACGGHCCKVGFIVRVDPGEVLYDSDYVHYAMELGTERDFRNMKSNGDGYTCIALGANGECTVWPERPKRCREFEVDGDRCRALRKHYGRP
jgi:Fe-S-cluster containining protein